MSLVARLVGLLRPLGERGRRAATVRARWLRVRATTSDGVIADVDVDVLLRPVRVAGTEQEVDHALDLLEGDLRHLVLGSSLAELPSVGDFLDPFLTRTVVGFQVEQAVVTRSEVSVTPELRRLVAPGSPVEPAWT